MAESAAGLLALTSNAAPRVRGRGKAPACIMGRVRERAQRRPREGIVMSQVVLILSCVRLRMRGCLPAGMGRRGSAAPVSSAALAACVAMAAAATGCGAPEQPPPLALHLVDLYEPASVSGSTAPARVDIPKTEWRFDGAPPGSTPPAAGHAGWDAIHDVAGLRVSDGRLAGRASGVLPILHVERTEGVESPDVLHSIEVRLRVSAGTTLSVGFSGEEEIDPKQVVTGAREFPFKNRSPLIPGDGLQTYTITPWRSLTSAGLRHVLLSPTDAAGATFEIESLRLIFRREYLAQVPSGVSWQGLAESYRETIVSRSPETIRFQVKVPEDSWLDLEIGSLEDEPVTFRVQVEEADGPASGGRILLERTLTRPHRWEPAAVELAPLAGAEVTLALTLTGTKEGSLGLWGAPVVRSRVTTGFAKARPAASGVEPPQGVILIWADTLRRDHLSAYGYKRETSPVLARMAKEGALFSDCLVNGTWTKVSTPALMTSLYPSTHGVLDFLDRLPAGVTTLAEVYRQAGYATLSMSSILFTGKMTNLHQGFEALHEDTSLPDQDSSKTAREYVDRLLPWIESHRDVPFFVFLHVSDPHDPYKPYAPYDTMWADPAKEEQHEKDLDRARESIADPLLRRFGMPTREEMEKAGLDPDLYAAHDRDWYDGSIRGMDAEIGRLLERLRGLGLEGRTLVVFAGDHGEEFLEHGRMFHGQSVYGELTNVPLIIWRPGAVPAGAVVGETVQIIDVMPTLLEASGLTSPDPMQGRSLLPLMTAAPGAGLQAAETGEAPAAFVEKNITLTPDGAPPPRDTESFAIVQEGWKLIHNTKAAPGRPEFELYDAGQDPLNQTDLASSRPEIVTRLAATLAKRLAEARAARLKPDAAGEGSLSAEELERLRSLGYIQ